MHLYVPDKKTKVKEEYVDSKGKKKFKSKTVVEKDWASATWKAQGWTADTVRFALAMAGDTMNDANFETDVANNLIIEFELALKWIQEVIADQASLRTGDLSIQDKVMHIRMDECIREADSMFAGMKFSQAMKWGYYDMRIARKKYREYHTKCGIPMHHDVIMRFIEASTIMLSPVATHWCENVWRNVLGKDGSVTKAAWPALSANPDANAMILNEFVEDTIKSIKDMRAKSAKKKKRKKKGGKGGESKDAAGAAAAASAGPPVRGVLYVQTTYPDWKKKVFSFLRSKWDDASQSFAGSTKKDLISGVMQLAKDDAGLQEQGKKLSGIVAYIVAGAEQRGVAVLSEEPPFDEISVLTEYSKFLASELELPEGITVVPASTAPEGNLAAANAEPGAPCLDELPAAAQ